MKNLQVIQINASVSLEAILSIPNDSISIVIFVMVVAAVQQAQGIR
jgi:hypothetical protein